MIKKKRASLLLLVLSVFSIISITKATLQSWEMIKSSVEITETKTIGLPIQQAAFTQPSMPQQYIDLTDAADKSIHAVVHIKSTQNSKTQTIRRAPDIYDFFFGDGMGRQQEIRTQPRVGFGSGVILTEDGYIVTNHHVIDNADVIDVTLNDNRSFKGRLIGSDENTDLALIKIEVDEKLPALPVGNSDDLKIGEWVLAVGNPFNLTSTVTAGIVNAKARTLGHFTSFLPC